MQTVSRQRETTGRIGRGGFRDIAETGAPCRPTHRPRCCGGASTSNPDSASLIFCGGPDRGVRQKGGCGGHLGSTLQPLFWGIGCLGFLAAFFAPSVHGSRGEGGGGFRGPEKKEEEKKTEHAAHVQIPCWHKKKRETVSGCFSLG